MRIRIHGDSRLRGALLLVFGSVLLCSSDAIAQGQKPQGIPIDDQLTIQKCGGCHQTRRERNDAAAFLHPDQSGSLGSGDQDG